LLRTRKTNFCLATTEAVVSGLLQVHIPRFVGVWKKYALNLSGFIQVWCTFLDGAASYRDISVV